MDNNKPDNSYNVAGALTYSSQTEENAQALPIEPRPPRNLQGLLRFVMEATIAEDAPIAEDIPRICDYSMDDERRKFLEDAIKNLTIDVAKVLHDAITTLSDAEKIHSIQLGQTLPEDVQTAFNNLMEFVDDIDIANDYYKMGGFAVFPICYGCENDEVRARASSLLAEVCQNNPFCQERTLECGLLNVLLNLVQTERGNALTKCIYALSCATREYPPACREICAQGACASLAQLLRVECTTARTKAAFFIRYLCQHYKDARDQFIEEGLVRIILEQIKLGRDDASEHLLSVLLALTEGLYSTVVDQCRNFGLKKILEDHLKHPDLEGDTFIEEKEYCRELLGRIYENYQDVECTDDGGVGDDLADR